uniref:Uncharacterized protein n=1 Tax=Ditylenchus dipsaci TaxID=166011 RepID=A0A915DA00_9BILA
MYAFRRRSTMHRPSLAFARQIFHNYHCTNGKSTKTSGVNGSQVPCRPSIRHQHSEGVVPNNEHQVVVVETAVPTLPNQPLLEGDRVYRHNDFADLIEISMNNCRIRDDLESGTTELQIWAKHIPYNNSTETCSFAAKNTWFLPSVYCQAHFPWHLQGQAAQNIHTQTSGGAFVDTGHFPGQPLLFKHNLYILLKYNEKFGLMHATTISTIITGIKPLINTVLIGVFVVRTKAHLKMLGRLDSLDRAFWSVFAKTPDVRFLSMLLFAMTFAIFCIPLSYRIFESVKLNESQPKSLTEWLCDYSFVLVPLFSVWNTLPLLYYFMCNRIICFWCRLLEQSMLQEHKNRRYSLKFYYQQFLRIADAQKSVGSLFNPFILFSLAWSLIMLCLTIYFITQPTSSLAEPITESQIRSESFRRLLTERVWLNLGWSAIQIVVATANIVVICATGTITNEMTRNILTAVLTIIPDTNAELDRFQISCFVHKMSTQYMWGMSVWRAFPLERTTFFTVVSVIITYSFLLLKLKDNTTTSQSILFNSALRQFINNGSYYNLTNTRPN